MQLRVLGFFIIFSVGLVSAFAAPLVAAENQTKIATISIQEVLARSAAAQKAQKTLEDELAKYQDKFGKEKDALEAMRSEIEKKSSVWSAEVKGEKEREYQRKVREFGVKNEDAKLAMQQLEKKVMEPILKELHETIAEIGKKEGYTLILENTMKGLRTRTGLLYAAESLDISERVRAALDARIKK